MIDAGCGWVACAHSTPYWVQMDPSQPPYLQDPTTGAVYPNPLAMTMTPLLMPTTGAVHQPARPAAAVAGSAAATSAVRPR
jgi:hypothetical protein